MPEDGVEVFNEDGSSATAVASVANDVAGWTTDANGPGDTQGETNGLYAGVTTNGVVNDGYAYLAANPATRTDLLSSFRQAISSVTGAVQSTNNARVAIARSNAQAAVAVKPSLQAQWAALSAFEKIGFISAVVGIVWFVSRKA